MQATFKTTQQTPLQKVRKYAARLGALISDDGEGHSFISVPHDDTPDFWTKEAQDRENLIINKVRARAALLGMNVRNGAIYY